MFNQVFCSANEKFGLASITQLLLTLIKPVHLKGETFLASSHVELLLAKMLAVSFGYISKTHLSMISKQFDLNLPLEGKSSTVSKSIMYLRIAPKIFERHCLGTQISEKNSSLR